MLPFLNMTGKIMFNLKKMETIKSIYDNSKCQTRFDINLLQIPQKNTTTYRNQQPTFALDQLVPSEILKVNSLPQSFNKKQQPQTQQKIQQPITCEFHKNNMANRIKQLQFAANKPIQDKMVSGQLDSIEAYTISIFDGHGGDQLSKYASQKVNQLIDKFILKQIKAKKHNQNSIQEAIRKSIINAYSQIENKFFENYQGILQLSNSQIASVGSCGITVLVHNNKIYVANLGDSQAIIVTQNQGNYNFIKGNERHSVSNSAERKRIQQKFAKKDEKVLTKDEKGRYYVKGRLQPTRSLGDYYLKKQKYYKKLCGSEQFHGPYIESQPEISVFEIQPDFKFIVVASDGIWDFLSKWDVVKTIAQVQIKLKTPTKHLQDTQQTQQEVDLSKTYIQLPKEDETAEQRLIQQVLKKCSKNRKISVEELKLIKQGQKRDYYDDISVGIINLAAQL